MINSVITYANEGNTYYGLELYGSENEECFYLLEIQRKKQELVIVQEALYTSWDGLASTIKRSVPLVLVVNTKNVLDKKVTLKTTGDDRALVEKAFPNLDFDAFYYQVTELGQNLQVSISKRDHVDAYIDKLKSLNVSVVDYSLGMSVMDSIAPYIDGDMIDSIGKAPRLDHPAKSKEHLTINGLNISKESIFGFAGILGYILKNTKSKTNFGNGLELLDKDFRHQRHFRLLLRSSLIFVLAILLINFLVFSTYYDKVAQLKVSSQMNSTYKEKLVQMQEDVDQKEKRVDAVLSSSNSMSSFFLDEIAGSVPESMLLSELMYQPLKRPVREAKFIELSKNVIEVYGTASNSEEFSDWIEQLEHFDWIQNVEVTNYDFLRNGVSNFSVTIHKDER